MIEKETESKNSNHFLNIKNYKAFIFIVFGLCIRIFMLYFYYITHIQNPQKTWGDIGAYYVDNLTSSPLTIILLILFRFLSYGYFEVFVFWGFFWDLLTCLLFYFVIKNFNIKNKEYVYGLFLINPFFFITNSFSLENCGYHISDAFFLFFLIIAFIFYPKKEKWARYLFYLFLGLSMCIKYYTLPATAFLLIKYFYDKNWEELKMIFLSIIPLIIIFLILPFFIFDWFNERLFIWFESSTSTPLFIKIIPITCIFLSFIFFRLKNSDPFEITIVATIAMASFMIFNFLFLRWFQPIIFYGILKEKEFFTLKINLKFLKKEIMVNNHILTFYLSCLAVIIDFILITY